MLLSILGLITVRTPMQLNALSMQTYMLGAVVGILFLLLAAIIANVIKFEGGSNPKDPGKRKMWFWLLLFISFAGFFLYNMLSVSSTISPNLQAKFMTTNIIGTVITLVIYLIFGFVLSKVFKNGKIGNWF